ncbi:hypothetical protein JOC54_003027 [Alkalihalobacillus xiaoxiensis]|uniref:Uncharacterized protein n=1 Tax=Shouchella xiaoxiensis TaxID=766895 RepID=A0ABS2SW39_9BACI|nr:hypothetical protein [Shouchella xiaoxiensis]MBM7839747.1 hypothetical protein [Shouchella xiaoxiensis]
MYKIIRTVNNQIMTYCRSTAKEEIFTTRESAEMTVFKLNALQSELSPRWKIEVLET